MSGLQRPPQSKQADPKMDCEGWELQQAAGTASQGWITPHSLPVRRGLLTRIACRHQDTLHTIQEVLCTAQVAEASRIGLESISKRFYVTIVNEHRLVDHKLLLLQLGLSPWRPPRIHVCMQVTRRRQHISIAQSCLLRMLTCFKCGKYRHSFCCPPCRHCSGV